MIPKLLMAALCGGLLSLSSIAPAKAQAPTSPPTAPSYSNMAKGYWWKYRGKMVTHIKGVAKEYPSLMTFQDMEDSRQTDGSMWHDMMGTIEPASKALNFPSFNTHTRYIEIGNWILKSDSIPNGTEFVYQPTEQYMKLPLLPGATWLRMPVSPRQTPIDNEPVTVSGPEDVIVPAGKFHAVKVTRARRNGTIVVKGYDWFAPNVGLVKSFFSFMGTDFEMDLVGYSVSSAANAPKPSSVSPATTNAPRTPASPPRPSTGVRRPGGGG
jgi:hypothetical protein